MSGGPLIPPQELEGGGHRSPYLLVVDSRQGTFSTKVTIVIRHLYPTIRYIIIPSKYIVLEGMGAYGPILLAPVEGLGDPLSPLPINDYLNKFQENPLTFD